MSVKRFSLSLLLIFFLILPTISTLSSPSLVVIVSNSVDIEAARQLNKALLKSGVSCFILRPDELWKMEYYSVETVIFLGGPLAYEGIGEMVDSYLTEEEEASLMEEGAMGFFVKFKEGRRIIILAGNTRNETREAVTYFFERILDIVKSPISEGTKANVIMVVVGTEPSSTPVGG